MVARLSEPCSAGPASPGALEPGVEACGRDGEDGAHHLDVEAVLVVLDEVELHGSSPFASSAAK